MPRDTRAVPFAPSQPIETHIPRPVNWRGAALSIVLLGAACGVAAQFDRSSRDKPRTLVAQTSELPTDNGTAFTIPGTTPPQPNASPNGPQAPPSLAPANPNLLPKVPPHAPWPAGKTPPNAPVSPAEAAFNKAVAAQQTNKLSEAIAAYREALHLKPDLLPARTNLAILLAQSNQPDAALVQLRAAQSLDAKNPAIPFQIAQLLLQLKRPAEALAPLRTAVALAPKNPQGHAMLAQLLLEQKKPDEALNQWREAMRANPKDAGAWFGAGVLALQMKKTADAETFLQRAVQLEPRDARGPLMLARAQAARGGLSRAEKTAVSGVHRFPAVVELWTLLAQIRRDRKNLPGAATALASAARAVPKAQAIAAAPLWAELGQIQAQMKKPRDAAESLEKAVELAPREPEFLSLLAEARLQSGDKSGAIASFDRTLQLDPKRLAQRRRLAQVLAATGQWTRARAEYTRYTEGAPNDIRAYFEWAQAEEEAKQPLAAVRVWQTAAKRIPENPLPHLQSARLLRAAGRDEQAIDRLRVVLGIAPNDPNALVGLAQLEEKTGQTARALSHWRALVNSQPAYAPGYDGLLRVSKKLNQDSATANILRQIVAKYPKNGDAARTFLQASHNAGDGAAARDWLKSMWTKTKSPAQRRAIDEFDLARAKEKLKELESAPTPKPTPKPTATSKPTPAATLKPTMAAPEAAVSETKPVEKPVAVVPVPETDNS
ncbi:MAG TPA: tetratricopeptide repeat protein [Abditibacteriaceae bacterium]|jgi:tetratricopeptide (TPR) repeat protein